jgi:hypothetical protein
VEQEEPIPQAPIADFGFMLCRDDDLALVVDVRSVEDDPGAIRLKYSF